MKIGMEFLILLLNSGLLLVGAEDLIFDRDLENINSLKMAGDRLPDNVFPRYYTIHFELDDMNRNISSQGRCKIDIQVNSTTKNISLHADTTHIQELYFQEMTTLYKSYVQTFRPKSSTYNSKNNVWAFFFDNKIEPGDYCLILTFAYTGSVDNKGLFRTSFINDEGYTTWLVALDFLPTGARRIFPCWDEPRFLAIFNIFIKYDYVNYDILSNTPAVNYELNLLDRERIHFEATPPIPTYHVSAILLSHFTTIKTSLFENDINLNIRYRQQLRANYISFARLIIDEVTSYFISQHSRQRLENTTGITHVVIPAFRHDAMSNLGLIYYRETAVIFDEKSDPSMRKPEIARLIGRSIAYQCFRNRINPTWWSYMWLIEGITTLLALDAIDEIFPHFRIKELFVVQTLQESLRFDDNFVMKSLISEIKDPSESESIFSMSYYMKAPSILRMLQHTLSNDIFWRGVNVYLSEDSSLDDMPTIDAFWTAIESVYDTYDIKRRIGLSIKQLMDAWTKQPHYPVVKVTQNNSLVTILVENTNTNEQNWRIPYTTATNAIKDRPEFSLLALLFDMHFPLVGDKLFLNHSAENNWIIINVQQIGYYRVNYDETALGQITTYLNLDEQHINKIHVLNRAQIIDDAFHFFMRNEIDLTVFLNLTNYLWQETDYIAWYPMFKSLEHMSTFFHSPHSSYIKRNMMRVVNELFVKTRDDSNYLIDSLKEEISRWACILGSSECKKEAYSKLQEHLKTKSVLPWKEWTYCNGLMIADNVIWNSALINTDSEKPDFMFLKFMACSEDFLIIRNYIELITSAIFYNETLKDYGQVHIFHSVVAKHAKNDTMLDYLLINLNKIIPRKITVTVALIDIINHVYTKEQLYKITDFLHKYLTMSTNDSSFKHPLMDDKLYKQIKACAIPELPDLIILVKISLFKRKIETRLHEIMKQEEYFQRYI